MNGEKTPTFSMQQLLLWLVWGWCVLYACLFVYHAVRIVTFPFDLDNSEAYLVYQGQRLAEGAFLYQPIDEPPYLVDNYPPIYPYLTAAGFYFTGTNFWWPRLLSFASTLIIAIVIGLWTWHRTTNRQASVFSALAFLSFYHVYDWAAYARVDMVGLLLSLLGLYVFMKNKAWWLLGTILFLASLYTRQTLFAAPLAVFIGLVISGNKRDAIRLVVTLALVGLALLLLLVWQTQGGVIQHLIVYNANEYRLSDLRYYFNHWIIFYTVWGSIPLAVLFFEHKGNDNSESGNPSLLFWYTLFAIGEALMCGKIGSAPNYLLSLVVVTSVGLGIFYDQFARLQLESISNGWSKMKQAPMIFFLCACLFQLIQTWHWPHSSKDFAYTPTRRDTQAGQLLLNELQRIEKPVLSDLAGIPLLAGHPPVYQPFICTQLARQGIWAQDKLLSHIQVKAFGRIVLQFDINAKSFDKERFTQDLIDTVRNHYELDRNIHRYYIYSPKS